MYKIGDELIRWLSARTAYHSEMKCPRSGMFQRVRGSCPPLKRLMRYKITRGSQRVSLRLGGNINVATFFAYLADWTRKRNFVLRHRGSVRGGEGSNRGSDLPTTITAQKSLSQSLARALVLSLTSFCAFRLAKHQSRAQAWSVANLDNGCDFCE